MGFEEATMSPAELAKKRGKTSSSDQGEDLNRNAGEGGTFGIAAEGASSNPGGSPEAVLSNFAGVLDFIDGNDVAINAGDLVPGNLKKDIFKQCVLADLQLTDSGVTDAKKAFFLAPND